MGKKSPKPPPAPDPVATANAQAAANKEAIQESAKVNAYDIFSPWGSITYGRDAKGVPTAQFLNLSDDQQRLFDTQADISNALNDQALLRARQLPTEPFNMGGLTQLPHQGDMEAYADRMGQAFFDRNARLLNQQFDRDRRALDQTLYDRGLGMGSGEAYDDEMLKLRNAQQGTFADMANQATLMGGQEAGRLFGLSQAARQQELSDLIMQRNQAFNEAAAFIQGAPVLPMPSQPQLPAYNMQPADIMGATYNSYNAAMNNYNQQMAQRNAGMSGLFGIGASIAGQLPWGTWFSSRAFKDKVADAPRVLPAIEALDVDVWRYKGDTAPHVGPYAEDFAKAFGVGNGREISVIDAVGVLYKAVQELAAEVRELKHGTRLPR